MAFDDVIAQPSAVRVLRRALETDRLASAYLFEGPSGVGKQRAAIAVAQASLCAARPRIGCGTCAVCRRVVEGSHPDVRVIPPRPDGNRNLPVELVRSEILPFAQFAPFEGSRAFLIFPEADVSFPTGYASAANALLKTLEEPKASVHFVLLAERADRLLATLRSRCQRVRFARLPPAVLARILEAARTPEAGRALAVSLADGRADRALFLAAEGRAEALVDAAVHLDERIAAARPGGLVESAERLAKDEALTLTLEALGLYYRDVAALALGEPVGRLTFAGRADALERARASLGAARAAARVRTVAQALEALERNANAELTLDALFFGLRRA